MKKSYIVTVPLTLTYYAHDPQLDEIELNEHIAKIMAKDTVGALKSFINNLNSNVDLTDEPEGIKVEEGTF